jgi:Family of unknown function (DUF6496)
MPEEEVIERAREDEREGKSASTQAGEFVREEMEHIREGKHGAQSTKQAIAIGLSKARRAGVKLAAPGEGKSTAGVRAKARQDLAKGSARKKQAPSPTRSRAITRALKAEGHSAASRENLSRQARASAKKRGKAGRQRAARKAARTRAHKP